MLWKIWCFTLQSMGRTNHIFPIHTTLNVQTHLKLNVQGKLGANAILQLAFWAEPRKGLSQKGFFIRRFTGSRRKGRELQKIGSIASISHRGKIFITASDENGQ